MIFAVNHNEKVRQISQISGRKTALFLAAALVLGAVATPSYAAFTQSSPSATQKSTIAMSISAQIFPPVSVQLFPLFRFAENDFCFA